jgi:hypothetical protein
MVLDFATEMRVQGFGLITKLLHFRRGNNEISYFLSASKALSGSNVDVNLISAIDS